MWERDWESVKPDHPVPRIRMRGLFSVEEGGKRLARFEGVDVLEERGRLDGGGVVGVGDEGREDVWERVVGAILDCSRNWGFLKCCIGCTFELEMKRKYWL